MDIGLVVFVHLSDIHFRHHGAFDNLVDYDADVRNELERDAVTMREQLGSIDAVLVSGDIAFSGREAEYSKADEWLRKLCNLLGCLPSAVRTTPGNHDVDRSVIAGSSTLRMYHANLRKAGADQINDLLTELTLDSAYRDLAFKPLSAYNEFAAAFGCAVDPGAPFWEDDLRLNDGSCLRIRGLTSSIISDANDSNGENKLVLGLMQTDLQRQDGVEYLTLCHHPPDWLIDGDHVHSRLVERARIQLFGHKHSHRIDRINDSLRISAGATHPDHREPHWVPRYNLVSLRVETRENNRSIVATVYPRVWDGLKHSFQAQFLPDGRDYEEHSLPIAAWTGPALERDRVSVSGAPEGRHLVDSQGRPQPMPSEAEADLAEARRLLNYRFWHLPFHRRMAVVQRLALLRDADKALGQVELFEEVFRRVSEADRLGDLWNEVMDEIHSMSGAVPPETNPFIRTSAG